MDTDELNRKLTKEFDVKESFMDEDGCGQRRVIQFTRCLDSCFKYLVPKILDLGAIEFEVASSSWNVTLWHKYATEEARAETPSLALCLAIKKWVEAKYRWEGIINIGEERRVAANSSGTSQPATPTKKKCIK